MVRHPTPDLFGLILIAVIAALSADTLFNISFQKDIAPVFLFRSVLVASAGIGAFRVCRPRGHLPGWSHRAAVDLLMFREYGRSIVEAQNLNLGTYGSFNKSLLAPWARVRGRRPMLTSSERSMGPSASFASWNRSNFQGKNTFLLDRWASQWRRQSDSSF